ncbi:ABC transporter substrate-binding protein [Loktanella salsilacus]|uniref:ABC transporter substrate-binding protein n=1 Tax=Loktanella salsilacus TaxID=195913 RepID=UPI0020B67F0C|nr:ABC transporter substrate-binding protein [Loktanella salsilacus]UTH49102.1 ABC transporter substrate-binding protein [Loktanella salsilacus]
MIRAIALSLLLSSAAHAQEAVSTYAAPGAAVTTPLVVRSTTDTEIFAPLLDAFVTAHPGIALTYEQWGSNALYAAALRACDGSGDAQPDAVISSGVHQIVDLVNRACARPYTSGRTLALPDARRWRNEVWGITAEAAVTIYNKDLVPDVDVPRTRFDLLDLLRRKPESYRGKIATYDIEASGLGYLFAFMDSQQATTFGGLLEGFARVDAVATCCSAEIISSVESGKFLIAYNVLGSYLDVMANGRVGVIYPQDYTLVLSRAYMIPKSAPHPEGAALLLDFILSPAGQTILRRNRLVQSAEPDQTVLQDSIQRTIPIAPTLLVAMDQARRRIFVGNWRAIFGEAY